jgi:hypothetical protein
MPNMFNSILTEAGLNLADVRLLRHKDNRAIEGLSPYELWRDDRQAFDLYQSLQSFRNRTRLNTPYWASFVATLSDRNMFVGIYNVKYKGILARDTVIPSLNTIDKAGSCDEYGLSLDSKLSVHIGKLFIDWGPGFKAWIQRADRQNKKVLEIQN